MLIWSFYNLITDWDLIWWKKVMIIKLFFIFQNKYLSILLKDTTHIIIINFLIKIWLDQWKLIKRIIFSNI